MLLKKITRLFKSHAVKQGSIVLIDQGIMSLVTFVTGVLIARSSNEQEYALYMLGWSVLLSIKGIQEALINLPLTVYVPRLTDSKLLLYRGSTLIHTVIFCFIATVFAMLTWFLNDKQMTRDNFDLIQMAPLLLFLLSAFIFRDYLRNALLAQLKIWASVRINSFASIMLIIAIVISYFSHKLTAVNAYLLFAITFGVAASVMFWQHRFQYKIDRSLLWLHFLENMPIGKWALIGNFAYIGSSMSYPWLILYFLDYESVAAYYACLALALAPGPLLRGTGAYVLPRMSHSYKDGSKENLIQLLRKSILLLSLPYLLWLIIGSIFCEEIIKLIYMGKYNGHGSLFILLLMAATINFVFAPLTNALQVLEKNRSITVSLIIGAFTTLLLGSLLIKEFGLHGAGISSIVTVLTTMAWRIFVF